MGRVNKNRQRLATRSSGIWEAVSIEEAFEDLSRPAFCIWIRMHTMTPNQLAMGRAKIAKVFRYSPDRSTVILRELFHKGYIVPESRGHFKSTTFHLTKRASIRGSAYFVLTSLKKSTRK
jgi:hypothetical protein